LIAFKVAEDLDVRLPAIVNQDGYITSHTAQNVRPLSDDDAYAFIGDYKSVNPMLNSQKPVTYGAQTEEDWHFEHKAQQHNALMNSKDIILRVFDEFKKTTGREYNLVEKYNMDDAEVAIVALGTTVETAMVAAQQLEEEGIKAGIVSPRVTRPFPLEEIADAIGDVKAIGCLDRSAPGGTVGMLYNEVSGALFNTDKRPVLTNYIYGLGGRDTTVEDLKTLFRELKANADAGKSVSGKIQRFMGVRGHELKFYNI
jgi:pyruvate ferredoxin oxidoreductase alpha subunit